MCMLRKKKTSKGYFEASEQMQWGGLCQDVKWLRGGPAVNGMMEMSGGCRKEKADGGGGQTKK